MRAPAKKGSNSSYDSYDCKDTVHSVRKYSLLSVKFRLNSYSEVLPLNYLLPKSVAAK